MYYDQCDVIINNTMYYDPSNKYNVLV